MSISRTQPHKTKTPPVNAALCAGDVGWARNALWYQCRPPRLEWALIDTLGKTEPEFGSHAGQLGIGNAVQ